MGLDNKTLNTKNIIFLGIINSLEEYYAINNSYPVFKNNDENDVFVKEDIESYNDKIIVITKEFVKQYFGEYKDIKELRQKAIDYFAKNIQGKTFDIGNFKNIRISRKSREKYESFSADERKLLIVPKLLEVLRTSKYKSSSEKYKGRKDHIKLFHYFINEILLRNVRYCVYITIAEDENGNLFYDLDENKTT